MQSLSGKLASLNRFLAKSAERSLPFFNTLKNITKEDKHEYRWTREAEEAFQQMKSLITDLLLLTPPQEKETLYAYLAMSAEAVSAVLLTDRKGRQCPFQYVSRKLSKAERNYDPMEKLAFSLIHMTRRLRRYFEEHPIKVITDQPIKNILNNTETSGKLQSMPSPSWVKDSSTNEHIEQCEVKMDSKLVASQINRSYEANKDSMIRYLAKAKEYASGFKSFSIENILRNMNQKADVLSKLASKGYLTPLLDGSPLQANYVIREIHMGSCGMHVGPRAMVRKAIHQGYYWPTMHEDAKEEWGMDILGPLPPARGGAKFMIVAIDYFTKWIKAKPLVKITGKEVIRFVMDNIICRFGLPKIIITDNGAQLAHQTSIKQSNRETPFSLTYGSEAVIPAEIGIPTYRTLMIREGYNEEEMRLNLDLLQEKREADAVREAKYKTKIKQYYNKKVRPASFRPGEFMFRRNNVSGVEDQGKLGPYRVVEAYENGSYKLQTLEDKEVSRTWHAINLSKCYM
ncbi:reverse transcriptase domain-containing protein [Tanacetum coccineum]